MCTKLRVRHKLLGFPLLDNTQVLMVLLVIGTSVVLTVFVLRCWFSANEACCRLAIHPWPVPTHGLVREWVSWCTYMIVIPQETLERDPGLKPGNSAETPMIRS